MFMYDSIHCAIMGREEGERDMRGSDCYFWGYWGGGETADRY